MLVLIPSSFICYLCSPQLCKEVSIAVKRKSLETFLTCATKDEQDLILWSGIDVHPVKARRPRNLGDNRKRPLRNRDHTFTYKLIGKSRSFCVCKRCFANIYGITESRIKRICALRVAGVSPQDKRGKHRPSTALSDEVFQLIKGHIASYPVQISHYSSNVQYYYLNPLLSVKTMWSMYVEKYPNNRVSYESYRSIFTSQFNLKFKPPQVDVCCTCEELTTKIRNTQLSVTDRKLYITEKMVHIRRAKKFYAKLEYIRKHCEDPEEFGISFDYMQNISLPSIPIQSTFYWRQLTVNVFSVCNVAKNTSKFYLSDERCAGKGPDETASYLYDYVMTEIPKEVKRLHVFADNCPGQNKNNVLLSFFSFLTQDRFEEVRVYFPMRGHSFLPNDRVFATVKRALRKHDRFYTLGQVRKIILQSTRKANQFSAAIMKRRNILQFKQWWQLYYKKNIFSEETKHLPRPQRTPFQISKYYHYELKRSAPGIITAKPYIDGLCSSTFIIRRKAASFQIPHNFPHMRRFRALKAAKLADLCKFRPYLPHTPRVERFWSFLNRGGQ